MNNISVINEENIKIKLSLKINQSDSVKFYNLRLFNDVNISSIKKKILKFLRLEHTQPDAYDFTVEYLGIKDFPLVDIEDFYLIISDLNINSENIAIHLQEIPNRLINRKVVKKKKEEQNKQKLTFDQNDKLIYNNEDSIIEINRPTNPRYLGGKGEVSCAFCKGKNTDSELAKLVGPVYGPFRKKKKDYFVHELCAIWTPNVYLDNETGKFKNLGNEISR